MNVTFTVAGTATAGTDYTISSSPVSVGTDGTGTIAVTITDDMIDDDDETITVTLADGTAYDLGTTAKTTVTITDNDDPPAVTPKVSFGQATYSAGEASGGQTVKVMVTVDHAPTANLSVSFTVGGTAMPGADYTALAGTVTVLTGERSAEIAVTITDDSLSESLETIELTLSDGAAYDLGTITATRIDVADNDTAGLTFSMDSLMVDEAGQVAYTVQLAAQPSSVVELNITSNNPDVTVSPSTLFILPSRWEQRRKIVVTAAEDDDTTDDVAVLSHVAEAGGYNGISDTVTVTVDDTVWPESWSDFIGIFTYVDPDEVYEGELEVSEGAGSKHFVVGRARTQNPQIPDAWGFGLCFGGTAALGHDYKVYNYRNLPLPLDGSNCTRVNNRADGTGLRAGQDRRHFYVRLIDDAHEDSGETIEITLNTPTNSKLFRGGQRKLVYTILNHDTIIIDTPQVSVTPLETQINEGTPAEFIVSFDPPSDEGPIGVTLNISGAVGYLSAGELGQRVVTVPAKGYVVVQIPTVDDQAREATAAVTVAATAGSGYELGDQPAATVTVVDNDPNGSAPQVSVTPQDAITEGEQAVFTITAQPAPATPLKVDITISQQGAWNAETGERTITIPTSGSVTLQIETSDDSTDEPNGTITVTVDPLYGYDVSPTAGSGDVAVADDDDPLPQVSIGDATAVETEPRIWFTVTLSEPVDQRVTVSIRLEETDPVSAIDQVDYLRLGTSVTFAVGETEKQFPVYILADTIAEGPETFQARIVRVVGPVETHPRQHTATGTITDPPPAQDTDQTQQPGDQTGQGEEQDPSPQPEDQPDQPDDQTRQGQDQDQIQQSDDQAEPSDDRTDQAPLPACIPDSTLQLARSYYEQNRDRPPNNGENWKRVLIAFGDLQDSQLTPYTAEEARQSEQRWSGWKPFREALECIEAAQNADPPPQSRSHGRPSSWLAVSPGIRTAINGAWAE